MRKIYLLILFSMLLSYSLWAQDRNNDDEVVKLERFASVQHLQGDVIVKFADNTVLQLEVSTRGGVHTGISSVDSLLTRYKAFALDRICPSEKPKTTKHSTQSYSGVEVPDYDLSRLCLIKIADTMPVRDLIEALNSLEEVEFAEPNYLLFALGEPTDDSFTQAAYAQKRGGLRDSATYFDVAAYTSEPMYAMQGSIHEVGLDSLWAADTSSSTARPVIAFLDTGVDPNHPDLAANIWHNPNETANGFDDDNNGFVDDTLGWDFVNRTAYMRDYNSHGTHCAGIAAAVGNNGIGITGANPNALIMPITVLQSNGSGDVATIIRGINYAKNNGADILNMSLGTYAYSIALEQALAQAYQTMVIVAASGNDGKGIDARCDPIVYGEMYPAAFSFVLGVQATNNGHCCSFSNYDCDGPNFSQFGEEKLFNYELSAPGFNILSTIPNGNYRSYNGTSMACPLVAGGIAALLHAKPYPSKEMLFGDLINTTTELTPVNFYAAYRAGDAPAQLQYVSYLMLDTANGDADSRADVGEILDFYPVIRSTWGATDSITCWMETREFEDTATVHFISNYVNFGQPLSAYAKGRSQNAIRLQVNDSLVDGRIIALYLCAVSPNAQDTLRHPIDLSTENCVELYGMISHNTTLYPNVQYVVTNNLVVPANVTLTLKPGTTLKFREGIGLSIASQGHLIAKGKPDSVITFTKANMTEYWDGIQVRKSDTLDYCVVEYSRLAIQCCEGRVFSLQNLVVRRNKEIHNAYLNFASYINSYDNYSYGFELWSSEYRGRYISLINETYYNADGGFISLSVNNVLPNEICIFNTRKEYSIYPLIYNTVGQSISTPSWNNFYFIPIFNIDKVYFGTAKESIARQYVYDINTPNSNTSSVINISNMPLRPYRECHGIVWKVMVNGYDAQDAFDSIIPLGVGRHRFEVYFNRAMNTAMIPQVTMGLRSPYTQHTIATDGVWSADSTVYTVYLDLDGASMEDGLYRIYVCHAQDNEFFDIPDEKTRFNVPVAAAGSMSAQFMATGQAGHIDLEWNNNEIDFNDFLGYNMYRYQANSDDTLLLNSTLITDTLFTDYQVLPNERYYYFYKVMRTNLSESDRSIIVSAMPLSSVLGDATGDYSVNVMDIIAVVNYISGQPVQPFVFDAADVNGDGTINLLDIVGIVNLIINPANMPVRGSCASATYKIDEGILFVDSPVELGGIQLSVTIPSGQTIQPLSALDGFEKLVYPQADGTTLFIAYSLSGRTIPTGKQPLLRIGNNSVVHNMLLSDPNACQVVAMDVTTPTGIIGNDLQMQVKPPYPNPFNHSLCIPYSIGSESVKEIEFVMMDITGRIVQRISVGNQIRGEYEYTWTPANPLHNGIYFILTRANGVNVQTSKVVFYK